MNCNCNDCHYHHHFTLTNGAWVCVECGKQENFAYGKCEIHGAYKDECEGCLEDAKQKAIADLKDWVLAS